ncbi:hypothetical protein AX774_g5595 [Zancudomyces culisetae]|uniref:Uncharacterized protein n=1 Tax=Zancudomyces culisetae TaxID=1213189 RepID=A0A1R1PJ14_ZANCU|nr:hypothetical protein AX774_g5595 [Zancudomyces culisetae]|eukprot:OMH80960.1 hypothetical protein AX774_g5595 [Zancudomyces culisetae]
MGGLYEFEKVTRKSLGAPGHYALSFALIFNGIGSCITYLIISGDIVTAISTEFISGVAIDRRIGFSSVSKVFTGGSINSSHSNGDNGTKRRH